MNNNYLCDKCFGIIKRNSSKPTISSYCDETGKDATLTKIKNAEEFAIHLREEFLKYQFELSSFKPKQRQFLEMAFERGAIITYNRINKK